MPARCITLKVFQPGNKQFRTIRLKAPPRKLWSAAGIESAIKQVADEIEKQYPNEEYELKELTKNQFNFVWMGAKK